MKLYHLFGMEGLEDMLACGYVSMKTHPTEPLRILNYTHKAQYDREWNPVTRQCRGLIVDDMNNIVARPWPKFFNYGEHEEGTLDLMAPVRVTDKADGSLGILYRMTDVTIIPPTDRDPGVYKKRYGIATRGSFTSEQAIHATQVLWERYDSFEPIPGITYLFEIVYPENRIVLDYEGGDDLIFLDALANDTGLSMRWDKTWPGPHITEFDVRTLRKALELPPRENAEGLVVTYYDGLKVKIKQDDYVALHRIVTGLNERTVWEMLGLGASVEDICTPLPDEFKVWVEGVVDHLVAAAADIERAAREEWADIITAISLSGNRDWTRKDFALEANRRPELRPFLFLLLDGRDEQMTCAIWKTLRPEAGRTPRAFTEDTA